VHRFHHLQQLLHGIEFAKRGLIFEWPRCVLGLVSRLNCHRSKIPGPIALFPVKDDHIGVVDAPAGAAGVSA